MRKKLTVEAKSVCEKKNISFSRYLKYNKPELTKHICAGVCGLYSVWEISQALGSSNACLFLLILSFEETL